METKKISKKLIARLPIYLNYLKSLPEKTENISATRIAAALNLGDVMVRKDLAVVSSGARRKLGYVRENLMRDIEEFLDVNTATDAVIVGAGRMGQALLNYSGFTESGMNIMAGFDVKPSRKKTESGKPIYTMDKLEKFCKINRIRIGIIAVPAPYAQETCDKLVSCGIEAIWNFAPTHLSVPENVVLQTENLAASLATLRMQLKAR